MSRANSVSNLLRSVIDLSSASDGKKGGGDVGLNAAMSTYVGV